MNGGAKFFATAAVLVATGCGGERPELQIRPTKTPLSATAKPVPYRIAEAHGQLALGNVALASESFRKALREQPDSAEAMVGLALSYDRMNRFDLSRRYYESALAIVPADTGVLNAFAQSLQQQGRSQEAAAVRSEIKVRLAAAKPRLAPVVQPADQPQTIAQVRGPAVARSVTVVLPPARRVVAAVAKRSVQPPALASTPAPRVAVAPPAPVPAPKPATAKAVAIPAPAAPVASASNSTVAKTASAPAPAAPPAIARKPEPAKLALPAAEPPVAIGSKLIETKAGESPALAPPVAAEIKPVEAKAAASPPASPVAIAIRAEPEPVSAPTPAPPATIARKPVEVAAAPSLPPPAQMPVGDEPVEAVVTSSRAPIVAERKPAIKPVDTLQSSPRLERLSLGEVALVTTGRPQWRPEVVSRTAQSTTVRFVPLQTAEVRRMKIKLLNAARYQGLAARTRRLFAQRGWRQLAIGNARRVRHTSLILYPANRRKMAERLGAQFGIAIARRPSGTELVILLGRDAAKRGTVQG